MSSASAINQGDVFAKDGHYYLGDPDKLGRKLTKELFTLLFPNPATFRSKFPNGDYNAALADVSRP
jgi:hypothetical protein